MTAQPEPTAAPQAREVVLFIDRTWSYCGKCGQMADPFQPKHETIPPGMSSLPVRPGCRASFTHVSSHYTGPQIRRAAQVMRPDLPWKPRGIEDVSADV